jgi:hypothetical protein
MRALMLAALPLVFACASAPKKADPPPPATTTDAEPEIGIEPAGALPKGTVVRQTLEVTPDVRRCYRETLRATPAAAYRLVLRVQINKTGHGSLLEAEADALDDAGRACLQAAVSEWFYEMPTGESAELSLPFDVAPGAD